MNLYVSLKAKSAATKKSCCATCTFFIL